MENLVQKIKGGIGKGVAVGLLGLTLGLGMPAIAHADDNNKKEADFLKALKIIEKLTDRVKDRLDEEYAQAEQSQNQSQYQDPQQQAQTPQTQYPQQDPAQLPQNQRHFFVCNYVNKNQAYPQDYIGIKDTFKLSEPLVLEGYIPYCKPGQTEKVDIKDKDGKVIDEFTNTFNSASFGTAFGWLDGTNKMTQRLYSKGGFGNYTAVFSLNDDVVGETEFTITQ